ncbi:hypothetical protein [Dyadobacter sp. CY356]|uniref:hypothetical protein n=1 Tax=Dyadobacter sp. CY356 TaxID=2906442 RepID=UPI001F471A48|nr:hypothetical protein [Dyadobacter sp. CY356]MCF0055277.1 hypothetical protein [Dyadobacter sp. CY356]
MSSSLSLPSAQLGAYKDVSSMQKLEDFSLTFVLFNLQNDPAVSALISKGESKKTETTG